MAVSHRLQDILAERRYALEYVQGRGALGQPVYAYVLMPRHRVEDFRKDLQRGVDVTAYGAVIAHGEGTDAPDGLEEAVLARITQQASV